MSRVSKAIERGIRDCIETGNSKFLETHFICDSVKREARDLEQENQFLKRFIKHCLWDDLTNWEKELGEKFDYDFSEPSFKELAEYCEELKGGVRRMINPVIHPRPPKARGQITTAEELARMIPVTVETAFGYAYIMEQVGDLFHSSEHWYFFRNIHSYKDPQSHEWIEIDHGGEE